MSGSTKSDIRNYEFLRENVQWNALQQHDVACLPTILSFS